MAELRPLDPGVLSAAMTSPTSNNVLVSGRRVKIVRGSSSQTVNICTDANEVGTYESTYRLDLDTRVDGEEFAGLGTLDAVRGWLTSRGAQLEVPGSPGTSASPSVSAPLADDPWVAEAQRVVDAALTSLIEQFIRQPYLHRVEHSLHTLLHSLLAADPHLAGVFSLSSGEETQLLHKEWPETVPRLSASGTRKRGSFDIAVLAPTQIAASTLQQFEAGRIDPPIVIEVGLDYGAWHLQQDKEKLLNSEVPVPYLLHLSRLPVKDKSDVETQLSTCPPPLRTAYAHVDAWADERRIKHLSDVEPASL